MIVKDRLDILSGKFRDSHDRLTRVVSHRDTLVSELDELQEDINRCKSLSMSYDKVQKFFQHLGSEEQTKLQKWIEIIVSYGLNTVFGQEFKFQITGPEIKGSEVTIGFEVIDSSGNPRDPYTELGGGLADVLSFLLQFVIVHLLGDRIGQFVFLDEPCKHLSSEYREQFAALIKELTIRTSMQMLIITHEPLYASSADKIYQFSKPERKTVVE